MGPLLKDVVTPSLQIYMREHKEFSKTPFEISKSLTAPMCSIFSHY
jgi:hypothetical protein